jgi:hypothetical protein
MPDEPDTRRQMLSIEGVDPTSGKTFLIHISHDRLLTVARRSMGQAKEAAFIVPATLQRPAAIFEGLRWDEDEDPRGVGWRCYSGIPAVAYRTDGTERPPYPGQVYLVFVNQKNVAYNWRWENADPGDPRLPMNFQARFTRKLL